jgi:hypothetical protein
VFLPQLIGLLQGSGSDGADAVASFAASIKVAKTTTDCSFVLAEPSRLLDGRRLPVEISPSEQISNKSLTFSAKSQINRPMLSFNPVFLKEATIGPRKSHCSPRRPANRNCGAFP